MAIRRPLVLVNGNLSELPPGDTVSPVDVGPFPSGTVAAPSITFVGDLNTGIYSPGADQVGISTNGVRRLQIDSTGLILPGSTSGTITITPASIAGTTTITLPATTGTVVTTGDSGTVTSTMIVNGTIVDGDINASAAIAGSKISPDFGAQTVTTTGVISAAAGTAAAPSITFTGDLNTGIYSPGADQVAISTNGTGRLFVDASGKVTVNHQSFASPIDSPLAVAFGAGASIGCFRFSDNVSGPSLRLSKSRSGTVGTNTLVSNGDTLGNIEFYGADGSTYYVGASIRSSADTPSLGAMPGTLIFSTTPSASTSPTERLRITAAGLVGVGTSSPARTLDVNGTARIADGSAIEWGGTSAYIAGTSASNALQFFTASSERLRIDSSGRVGIGTSSVSYKLDINNTSGGNGGFRLLSTDQSTTRIRLENTGVGGRSYEIVGGLTGVDNSTFTVYDATAAATRLAIDSSGRVGIGTTSPSKLFVVSDGGNIGYEISPNDAGNGSMRSFAYNRATSAYVDHATEALNFRIATGTSGVSEKLRVDSSGRLLVGTSSSLATKYQASSFQPGFQSAATSGTGGFFRYSADSDGPALVLSKSRNASTGSQTVVVDGDTLGYLGFTGSDGTAFQTAATILTQVDGTPGANDMPGRLVFSTTADASASPTERMRITSIGRVGVNQTAPATTFDLIGAYSGNAAAVSALDIDCSSSNYFTKTINGNSTFTVSNVPASRNYAFTLELEHTSGTITWFSGVEWPGGVAPTLTTGKTHLFMFQTDNGGTRWRASSLVNYTT